MHQILLRTVSNKRTFSIIASISPSLRELFFNKNLITSNLKYDKAGTNNLLLKSNQGREPPPTEPVRRREASILPTEPVGGV